MNEFDLTEWLAADDYACFYADECRRGLFAGFLTVATFLFSVKTFLLVTLHRDIYSDPKYVKFREQLVKENLSEDRPLQPLKRLSDRLHISTLLALSAAIAQFTVGMLPFNWAASIATLAGVASVGDLCLILSIQKEVIDDWIKALDEKCEDQNEEQG
ncbi:hypothetical protein LOC71_22250 [Rhodopirellula sp. JC740]|uniref:DUF2721 domain-containing protein n=1 Tax=Rhodopirellula halodulae TaxID=2894198 RepID=A0ABS8NN46_9BACT|nr:hypothetical protein [Rhodopirellula sp. JC740]MCC9645008.1 hypothetical protein [Rhodopirellula sp. JC740]